MTIFNSVGGGSGGGGGWTLATDSLKNYVSWSFDSSSYTVSITLSKTIRIIGIPKSYGVAEMTIQKGTYKFDSPNGTFGISGLILSIQYTNDTSNAYMEMNYKGEYTSFILYQYLKSNNSEPYNNQITTEGSYSFIGNGVFRLYYWDE